MKPHISKNRKGWYVTIDGWPEVNDYGIVIHVQAFSDIKRVFFKRFPLWKRPK